jgi:hypothetical protein
MKKMNVLYVKGCIGKIALLVINPQTDDEIAINAIAEKITEMQYNESDCEDDEYYVKTEEDEIRRIAERIWLYNDDYYMDNTEYTYLMQTNVDVIL